MNAVINLIRGTVAIVALVILTGAVIMNPIFTGWVGGYLYHQKVQNEGVEAAYERHYKTLCAEYRDASFLDRWTNIRIAGNGWCKDYLHRL
ncbi:hypothetical protein [Agrobacterium radiobacter]|uniref:hypothetical protein n=1 Tax=Agrobacterium radiobacter TaxID=362 RepID=UPI003CE584AE